MASGNHNSFKILPPPRMESILVWSGRLQSVNQKRILMIDHHPPAWISNFIKILKRPQFRDQAPVLFSSGFGSNKFNSIEIGINLYFCKKDCPSFLIASPSGLGVVFCAATPWISSKCQLPKTGISTVGHLSHSIEQDNVERSVQVPGIKDAVNLDMVFRPSKTNN